MIKLIIPYKGNEQIRLPHLFQVLIKKKVLVMNDIMSYVHRFRLEESIFFKFELEKLKQIEMEIKLLGIKYKVSACN